jgi:hypothetical protein
MDIQNFSFENERRNLEKLMEFGVSASSSEEVDHRVKISVVV